MKKNKDTGALSTYMKRVNKHPLLTREEEVNLAKKCQSGSKQAREQLIKSNLRFVAKIAYEYKTYCVGKGSITINDLIQEGNSGLIHAVDNFDPDKGYRLISYAVWKIRAKMHQYLMNNFSIMRIGTCAATRTLFFKIREVRALEDIMDPEKRHEARRDIAKRYKHVSESNVMDFEKRLSEVEFSMDVNGDCDRYRWHDILSDGKDLAEDIVRKDSSNKIRNIFNLCRMSARERDIVFSRYMRDDHHTLDSLGKKYGISRERVRQLEVMALNKLRRDFVGANLSMSDFAI